MAFPEGFAQFALEDLVVRIAWERVDPVDRRRALESGQPLMGERDDVGLGDVGALDPDENTATAVAGSVSEPP